MNLLVSAIPQVVMAMKPAKRLRNSRRPETAQKNNFLSPVVREMRNGLRYVNEYEYEFNAFAKGRWVNRTLLEVCAKEFLAQTPEYYEQAVSDGRITVNQSKVSINYVLDHNDLISHKAICQENPVSGEPIEVLFEDEQTVAVLKPCSIPVHPCGGYRLNTLVSILQDQRGDTSQLLPAHRIDRLTSGLVVFGKTPTAASTLSTAIQNDESVVKEYLALVKGEVSEATRVKGYIKCIDFRVGKFAFSETLDETKDSKYSETEVNPLKYFSERNETLVKCRPLTGRTHQIRLHLQSIGHAIVNDICYGGEYNRDHKHAIPQIPSLQHDNIGKMFCGGIFLHAHRYQIPSLGLDITAPPPLWAEL